MRREFAMPDVGEGLTEADILTWHVAPGDVVVVNQVLVEIETAKAAVELPSPWAGTVGELLAQPGETVEVGRPIIAIETAGAGPGAGAPGGPGGGSTAGSAAASAGRPVGGSVGASLGSPAAPGAGWAAEAAAVTPSADERGAKIGEAGPDGRIATLVGYGPRPGSVTRRPRRSPTAGPAPARAGSATSAPPRAEFDTSPVSQDQSLTGVGVDEVGVAGGGAAVGGSGGDLVPLAKPPVRKLARDLGVDLRAVTGTGAGGVITREDVEAFAGRPVASGVAAARGAASGGERREPIRGVRKATAAAMVASAFTAPHVTEFLAVDVTATMELRARLRASREYTDIPLTPLAFVAKAVCLAARRTPEINTHWDEAAGEIVYYDRMQLGIAAATPRGLIVPKIRDADTLSLRELAVELHALTGTARAGRTPPADLVGGTFTITNVGVFGVDTGTPILNPGEAAILAVGAIKQAPWVVEGQLAVRTVGQLALSFDHRLIDGEQGSRFLADVGALLADPGLALTW